MSHKLSQKRKNIEELQIQKKAFIVESVHHLDIFHLELIKWKLILKMQRHQQFEPTCDQTNHNKYNCSMIFK